jgi:hypothetical protein
VPRRAFVVFFILSFAFVTSGHAAIAPRISFEKEAVIASGVTPGGEVVWFSVAREISLHTATIVPRQQIVKDTARAGIVRLELDREIPFQSIWVAIDLTTGALDVAVPQGYPLRRFEIPASNLRHDESGDDWIESTRGYVALMLVRPENGAWWSLVGDGGIDDDDGVYDGRLVASLPELREVEGSDFEAPESFAAKDVVIVIDPNAMAVGTALSTGVSK